MREDERKWRYMYGKGFAENGKHQGGNSGPLPRD
jgi:hypothetical protein